MWDDDERKGVGQTQCRLIACSSRKAPRGPPGLTSPSDGRIAVNSTICLLNIHLRKVLEFNRGLWCTIYLLAPRLKIFKLKFTTPPGIEPRTCWIRGRSATISASAASTHYINLYTIIYFHIAYLCVLNCKVVCSFENLIFWFKIVLFWNLYGIFYDFPFLQFNA